MIKVCHMTSVHGAEDVRIFHKESISLAKAGYDVYLVAQGDTYEKNGVHIVGVGQLSGNRLSRMVSFSRRVYQAALEIDADLYHFHDPELLPYGLKLKKKGKKVIFDSHENTVEQILEKTWIPTYIRKPMCWIFDRYQRRVCRKLDAVVTVSPHIVEYFQQVQPRVAMVTNYPAYRETVRAAEPAVPALCFAGGISEQWNHDKIIRAMESVEQLRYVLCGPGEEAYLERLRKLPAWDRVDYRGRVPHTEVNQILSECSIGMAVLSYSYNTAFQRGTLGNTKIYEQMMAGLPVICTDFQIWSEMVEKYHCGICISPGNADEIASAILYLLDHPEEARRMGENGRRAVKEEFNWDVEEKKLLALYEDIFKE